MRECITTYKYVRSLNRLDGSRPVDHPLRACAAPRCNTKLRSCTANHTAAAPAAVEHSMPANLISVRMERVVSKTPW